MTNLERNISISAPVEKVFNYLTDWIKMPEWLPGMIEVKDITGQGVETHFRWTYKMAGIRFDGESKVTEYIPNEKSATRSKLGIVSIWTWTFKTYDGGTKLNLDLQYTIPVPVLGKLVEGVVLKQNEREADLAMENIKANLEN